MTQRLQFSLRALLVGTAVLVAAAALLRPRPAPTVERISVSQLGETHVLLGRTHQPLGEMTTLVGVVVDGPSKGYDDGPNLRVQFINGEATQEIIELKLVPSFVDLHVKNLGDPDPVPSDLLPKDLWPPADQNWLLWHSKLLSGHTYEFRGYESGEYVGVPPEAVGYQVVQGAGFHLHLEYAVAWAKEVPPVQFRPSDFVDRQAVLEGTAEDKDGQAFLAGSDWRLLVDAAAAWPQPMVGKEVAVLCTVRRSSNNLFHADRPEASLVKLADQLGQQVRLRGEARSWNDDWSLVYRGTRIHLGSGKQLLAAKIDPEYGPAIISGRLTETPIPQDDSMISTEEKRRGKRYSLQVASWQQIDSLLSPELGPAQ